VSDRFRSQSRVILPGSEKLAISSIPRTVAAQATEASPAPVTVTVVLTSPRQLDPASLASGQRLSREEFAKQFSPDAAAVDLLQQFAAEFSLTCIQHPTAGPRSFLLTGSEEAMQEAFGTTLTHHEVNGFSIRARHGTLTIPSELGGHIQAVLGLDNRPQARPHFRRLDVVAPAAAGSTSYTPSQVGQLYGFPQGATATGQTIGIIELGGGFQQTDITTYFQQLQLPAPQTVAVLIDGGINSPGDPNGADGEVMLDIEVTAAVAPGVKLAVYFAPNTDQGFIDAIASAVHDTTNKPGILSISWGGPESTWTGQAVTALDQACQAAAALGITITVACGDSGSTDGVAGTANHVDFPASSPHVLACGGTRLVGAGTTIASEVVWNELATGNGATGGGISALFPLPIWQQNANVPPTTSSAGGRGVPDVAGDADPASGYQILVDGQTGVIGGTSAVAPLWAGLIALANQQNGNTAGFINPTLYANGPCFNDITSGSNGAFSAGPGWDPCTGLGSPRGAAIIQALQSGIKTNPSPMPTPVPKPPIKKHHHPRPKHAS